MLSRAAGVVVLVGCLAGCRPPVVEAGPDAPADGFVDVIETSASGVDPAADAALDPGTDADVVPSGPSFEPGDCVSWDQGGTIASFERVDCEVPHLAEVVGTVELSMVFPEGSTFPDPDEVARLVDTVCSDVVAGYLAGASSERTRAGIVLPTDARWAQGDRTAWCTVGLPRVDGRRPTYTGRLVDRS